MPLTKREINLAAEAESLAEEMEGYAQTQAEAPVGSGAAQQAATLGQQAERLRNGVLWLASEFDADSITLAALTAGERNRVRDTVDDTGWKLSDCYVAAGTHDAPYLNHDPKAVKQDEFEATCKAVVDLSPAFVDWAESKISDISRAGVDTGKSYQTLVLEKRLQQTSQTENG